MAITTNEKKTRRSRKQSDGTRRFPPLYPHPLTNGMRLCVLVHELDSVSIKWLLYDTKLFILYTWVLYA